MFPSGEGIRPHLIHGSLYTPASIVQIASQLVQSFFYGLAIVINRHTHKHTNHGTPVTIDRKAFYVLYSYEA